MSGNVFDLTLYNAVDAPEPYPLQGLSWDQVVSLIGQPKPFLSKESANLFAPHRLFPNTTRAAVNVACITFGVFDFDEGLTPEKLEVLLARLRDKTPFVFASTFRHGIDKKTGAEDATIVRGRLFMPFTRPVLPSEWPRLWAYLDQTICDGISDGQCKSLERAYYQPSYPEGGKAPPIYITSTSGAYLDVNALILEAPQVGTNRSWGSTPTIETLRWLSAEWKKSKKTEKYGEALYKVVRGEPFAETGERDSMLWEICRRIASVWKTSFDVERTADLFAPSLMFMGGDGPSHANVVDKLRRAAETIRKEASTRISRAFCNGRSDGYSDEEYVQFAMALGCEVHELRNRWVIQKDHTFYVFSRGKYDVCSLAELSSKAHVALAPAITMQVDTEIQTDRANRPMTPSELVNKWGTVAHDVEVDMRAQQSFLDYHRNVFVEAPCPLRYSEPVHNAEIAKYLELFGGKNHEIILKWIAALTFIDRPCAGLYLNGPRGAGKSLFAQGFAQLWFDRATELEELFADFNDAAMKCPLVLADEKMPVLKRGEKMTGRLREVVQSYSRPLRRKFMPNATLKGAIRLVLAANNDDMLQSNEILNMHDFEAISERFVYHEIEGDKRNPPAAKLYLSELHSADPKRRIWTEWVEGGALAKHALWLRDNITLPNDKRFIVEGQGHNLARTLTINTGLQRQICTWLVSFLLQPDPLLNIPEAMKLVRVHNNKLLVNSRLLSDHWDVYVKNDTNPPDATRIAKGLSSLSLDRHAVAWDDHFKPWYREIDLEALTRWVAETQWGDSDSIAVALVALWEKSNAKRAQARLKPDP